MWIWEPTFPLTEFTSKRVRMWPQLTKLEGCSELVQVHSWPAVKSFFSISCLALAEEEGWEGVPSSPCHTRDGCSRTLHHVYCFGTRRWTAWVNSSKWKICTVFQQIIFQDRFSSTHLLKHLKASLKGSSNSSWSKFSLLKIILFSIPWTLHLSDD